jgi:hypothetical protein
VKDIQRAARPAQLGVATSSFQAISYLGFAFRYLLTVAHSRFGCPPANGLIIVTAVAVVCAVWLSVSTRTKQSR